jgi:Protein of unknown function (DUF4231)
MSAPTRSEQLAGHLAVASEPKTEPPTQTAGPAVEGRTQPPNRLFRRPSAGDVARAPETAGRLAYEDRLQQELSAVIDQLELSDFQKSCLRARWLDAVLWMDGKARQAQRAYYALRLLIIIGGVIIPALVSLDLGSNLAGGLVRWTTFALSLLVAIISAAIEGFFRYGERWRHYRAIVERLKIEGWQFFQLSGPYAQHGSHTVAYTAFAARVEEIIQSDVQQYITEVVPGEAGGYGEIRSACAAFRLAGRFRGDLRVGSITGRRILLTHARDVPNVGLRIGL